MTNTVQIITAQTGQPGEVSIRVTGKKTRTISIGCAGSNSNAQQFVAEQIAQRIRKEHIAAVLIQGDYTYIPFSNESQFQKIFDQLVRQKYAGVNCPVLIGNGNHEGGNFSKTVCEGRFYWGTQNYHTTLRNAQIASKSITATQDKLEDWMMLNTSQPAKKFHQPNDYYKTTIHNKENGVTIEYYTINSDYFWRDDQEAVAQRAWLEAELRQPKGSNTYRVLCPHHNFYTPSPRATHGELGTYNAKPYADRGSNIHQFMRQALQAMAQNIHGKEASMKSLGIDVVTAAHDHYNYLIERDGILYVGAGGGGSTSGQAKFGFVEPGLKYLDSVLGHTELAFDAHGIEVTMFQHMTKEGKHETPDVKRYTFHKPRTTAANAAAASVAARATESATPSTPDFLIPSALLGKTKMTDWFKSLMQAFLHTNPQSTLKKFNQEFQQNIEKLLTAMTAKIEKSEQEIHKTPLEAAKKRLTECLKKIKEYGPLAYATLSDPAQKEKTQEFYQGLYEACTCYLDHYVPNPKNENDLNWANRLGTFALACCLSATYPPETLKEAFPKEQKNLPKEIRVSVTTGSPPKTSLEIQQERLANLREEVEDHLQSIQHKLTSAEEVFPLKITDPHFREKLRPQREVLQKAIREITQQLENIKAKIEQKIEDNKSLTSDNLSQLDASNIKETEESVALAEALSEQSILLAKQMKDVDRLIAVKMIVRDAICRYLSHPRSKHPLSEPAKFGLLKLWNLCCETIAITDEELLRIGHSLEAYCNCPDFVTYLTVKNSGEAAADRVGERLLSLFELWDDQRGFSNLNDQLVHAQNELQRNFPSKKDPSFAHDALADELTGSHINVDELIATAKLAPSTRYVSLSGNRGSQEIELRSHRATLDEPLLPQVAQTTEIVTISTRPPLSPVKDTLKELPLIALFNLLASLILGGAPEVAFNIFLGIENVADSAAYIALYSICTALACISFTAGTAYDTITRIRTRRQMLMLMGDEESALTQTMLPQLPPLTTPLQRFIVTIAESVTLLAVFTNNLTREANAVIAVPCVLGAPLILAELLSTKGMHTAPVVYTGERPKWLQWIPEKVFAAIQRIAQGLLNAAMATGSQVGLPDLISKLTIGTAIAFNVRQSLTASLLVLHLTLNALLSLVMTKTLGKGKAGAFAKIGLIAQHAIGYGALGALQTLGFCINLVLLSALGAVDFSNAAAGALIAAGIAAGIGIGTAGALLMKRIIEHTTASEQAQKMLTSGARQLPDDRSSARVLGNKNACQLFWVGTRQVVDPSNSRWEAQKEQSPDQLATEVCRTHATVDLSQRATL